ncbi:hypothetical protein GGD52_003309 [Agrobacterium tumefaciens]|nr:hypothetical protein [Agrobacterium radiobacter]MBB5588705.1 hypothetical protein [Agrobacterium radiobacter]
MRFVKFNQVGVNDKSVYVNPDMVVAVRKSGENQTYILIAAADGDGRLSHIAVREEPEDVIAKLIG